MQRTKVAAAITVALHNRITTATQAVNPYPPIEGKAVDAIRASFQQGIRDALSRYAWEWHRKRLQG